MAVLAGRLEGEGLAVRPRGFGAKRVPIKHHIQLKQ